jgi:tetratricopeptide (TPR) repeat protein
MTQLYESLIDSQSRQTDQAASDNLCTNIASMLERPDWLDQLEKARQQLPPKAEGSLPLPLAEMMLQTHSGRVIESLSAIREMTEQNMYRTAAEEAFFALMYAPGYLPIHIQIGELLLKENREQEAIQKFSIVAQVYSARGETAQATQLLRRVMQLSPMDLSVRGRLIDTLMAQGKVDEAIREDLEMAETYYRLTELEMARKTYMTALRLAQQSSSNRKWSTRILTRIADIDMQRMDWRQALRVFEQIRVLQPDDEKVRQNMIDINFRIGQDSAGLTELDSFINYLEGKGQRGKAIQFLQAIINDRPEKVEFHRRLADLFQKAGQTAPAIAELDIMGDLFVSSGNKVAAINVIQTILTLNPPNATDYQKLLAQLRSGK